jgi:poly-beta-1,6-N-acetyl-D-glucosamine synthase
MKVVFWLSVALIVYTYVGYPAWLWAISRRHALMVQRASICPSVSIVIAVHNEAQWLSAKLRNLAELDYPSGQLEIIVVSDGSTDETNQILANEANESLRLLTSPRAEGKASALNQGIRIAHGEIVVFTDARQIIDPQALRHLVSNFADPTVGAVTGELFIGARGDSGAPLEGVGLYWRIEKEIRKWEAATGSVVGATGALYAVRRRLLVPLPVGTILDDVYTPLEVVHQGCRVVFEPQARAWDPLQVTPKLEFQRKIRTLTGNYQLLQLMPWLLSRANPLRFRFASHKLLRLIVPFLLAGVLVSSLLLKGNFYRFAVVLQLVFYGLGLIVLLRPRIGSLLRPANFAFAFLLLNTAAVVAFANFVLGRKEVWVRSR